MFHPSILDNITNCHVLNDDNDILSFLTSEGSYSDQIIDEDDHECQIKQRPEDNSIPKSVVRLEYLYDIRDRFKQVINSKLQSFTLRFELINLGTEAKSQNIILGLGLTSEERFSFIKFLNK